MMKYNSVLNDNGKSENIVIRKKKYSEEDSRWRCENNPGLKLSVNLWRGESELHIQTDLCCPQNGEIPKYKGDVGRQEEALPGEAGSQGGGASPTQSSPQGVLVQVPC